MPDYIENSENYLEKFPRRIIIVRWLFALAEGGLASYFVFSFGFSLGLAFMVYGLVALFVLLPMIRCVRCSYYGKRCNFGMGKWASAFFQESEKKTYAPVYGNTMLFWPLRIIPIGLGIIPYLGSLRNIINVIGKDRDIIVETFKTSFGIDTHAFFLVYLLLMYLHRKYYRSKACTRCMQRAVCPVYDMASIKGTLTRP